MAELHYTMVELHVALNMLAELNLLITWQKRCHELETVAHNKRILKSMEEVEGRCYKLAAEKACYILGEGAVLVHGKPRLQIAPHVRYGHAWVELGDYCWDPIKDQWYPLLAYYSAGKIDPLKTVRYTKMQTLQKLLEEEHWGPWHEDQDTPAKNVEAKSE